MSKKLSTYKRKHQHKYAFGRCAHNQEHTETHAGVRYAVCNACNTVRDNELTARLQDRRFHVAEELAVAA